jgi:putative aminopeptidase FrvX
MSVRRPLPRYNKKVPKRRKKDIDNTKMAAYNKRCKERIKRMGDETMKQFKQELFELLTIQAPSGHEHKVVKWLMPRLEKLTDRVFQDSYGNLLAEKVVGDGNGATVILSAHMDTVSNIQKGRKVLFDEKTQTFRSSKGVLGADDRAGIAIILAVLRNIEKTSFNGKIKVCFSREEEVGCVGASKIPVDFYKDANLAIVVDRRGRRDIVTGCGEMYGFCSEAVGKFFEDCSALLDMDWKAVPGGVSDALVFSGNGVHSVNLSAGYENEHTSKETVHLPSCRDTINLILQAFSVINTQYHKFGSVPVGSRWSSYDYLSAETYYELQNEYYYTGEVTFYDAHDTFGSVTGTVVSGFVSLYQASPTNPNDKSQAQEVFMDEKKFRRLIDQYCLVTGYEVGTQLKRDAAASAYSSFVDEDISGEEVYYHNGTAYTTNSNGELVPME